MPTSYVFYVSLQVSCTRSHLQFVQLHAEVETDLRRAMELEDVRRQGSNSVGLPWPPLLLYSDHVRYVDQLHRYRSLFPARQILVLIYDDFRRDNIKTVRTVQRFLGVDDTVPVDVMEANPSVSVRSGYLNRLLYEITMGRGRIPQAIKTAIKAGTPQQLRRHALQTTYSKLIYSKPQPPDQEWMTELRRRFKPEVVALSKYLDRDLVKLWGYDHI